MFSWTKSLVRVDFIVCINFREIQAKFNLGVWGYSEQFVYNAIRYIFAFDTKGQIVIVMAR